MNIFKNINKRIENALTLDLETFPSKPLLHSPEDMDAVGDLFFCAILTKIVPKNGAATKLLAFFLGRFSIFPSPRILYAPQNYKIKHFFKILVNIVT